MHDIKLFFSHHRVRFVSNAVCSVNEDIELNSACKYPCEKQTQTRSHPNTLTMNSILLELVPLVVVVSVCMYVCMLVHDLAFESRIILKTLGNLGKF